MMIKCPCLLHSDQLSLFEDSKSPHIAHIRGLLVKLLSQLSEWGVRLQLEEQRSNKKSLNNVCLGLVWSNKSSLILYRTPTHTDIDSAEELPWMFSSCSSKWSRWRWSRCRRHSWSSSLASKPWKIWTWQILFSLPQRPFTNSFSQRFGTLVPYLWIAHKQSFNHLIINNQHDNQ